MFLCLLQSGISGMIHRAFDRNQTYMHSDPGRIVFFKEQWVSHQARLIEHNHTFRELTQIIRYMIASGKLA